MASDMTSTVDPNELRAATEGSRKQFLESLQGRVLHIPDLQALMSHWPHYVNPELDRLREDVDNTLRDLFPESRRFPKMILADPVLFGASWWPYASFERLTVATYLSIWVCDVTNPIRDAVGFSCLHGTTDSVEFSSLVLDLGVGRIFREESLRYIRKCLSDDHLGLDMRPPSQQIIEFFGTFGRAISSSYNATQTRAFLDDFKLVTMNAEMRKGCTLDFGDELRVVPTLEVKGIDDIGHQILTMNLATGYWETSLELWAKRGLARIGKHSPFSKREKTLLPPKKLRSLPLRQAHEHKHT